MAAKHQDFSLKRTVCVLLVVVMSGCSAHDGQQQPGAQQAAGANEEHSAGHEVYTKKCGLCHDHGEAGSPRLGNIKQWAKRVLQGEAVLTKHAIEGFEGKWGEMPPQGDDLSPKEVGSAVRYMMYRYEQATLEAG